MKTSGAVYAALLVVCVGFGLGAILLLQPGPESTQRLGLFFGLVGTAAAALVSAIRSDRAANAVTNGELRETVRRGVTAASGERRYHDPDPGAVPGDPLRQHPDDPGEAGELGAG